MNLIYTVIVMKEAGEGLKEPKPVVFEDIDFHSREGINSLNFSKCFSLYLNLPLQFSFLLFILPYSKIVHLNFRK